MKLGRAVTASILAVLCVAWAPSSPLSVEASAKGRVKTSRSKAGKPVRTAKAPRPRGATTSSKSVARTRAAERARAAARRREELARLAAVRRADEAMRDVAMSDIGRDDLRGEDPAVREAALSALGRRAGTVVVMDPNTGRVFSVVNQRMAVGTGVKPCSTFKPVVALAAMREKIITPHDAEHVRDCECDSGLDDALAYSNNEFFQRLGRRLGLERLRLHARELGFGEPTGVNLPNENSGVLPTEVPADGIGRVASHGDGIRLTAMQLAAFVAAVANGGSLYRPQVVRPGQAFVPVLRRQIDLDPAYRLSVLHGMAGAVNYGTARKARNAFDQVAGKTGSCIEGGSWDGLFFSFSSVDHPNLVVVVVTRGSAARGPRAADIAGDVYEKLADRFGSVASRPRRVAVPVLGVPATGAANR